GAIMKEAGSALMGIGRATGENRAVEAARQAIASPLLEVNITGAQGILFNITGSSSLSLFEVTEAAEEIRAAADPEANIIFGTSFNERLGEEVMITVIATGFDGSRKRESPRHSQAAQPTEGSTSIRAPRERDFLEELERQRLEASNGSADVDRDDHAAASALRAAVAAGLTSFGENRVQEAEAKIEEVEGATWHLVGPLQSNKARRALLAFETIETVDSVELAQRLDRLAAEVRPAERLP